MIKIYEVLINLISHYKMRMCWLVENKINWFINRFQFKRKSLFAQTERVSELDF